MLTWEVTFTALDGAKETRVMDVHERALLLKRSCGPFFILGQVIHYGDRRYWKARLLVEEERTGSLLTDTDRNLVTGIPGTGEGNQAGH